MPTQNQINAEVTSGTLFDIKEKSDILIKSAFGFPSTSETKAWFSETQIPANNFVFGEDILVDEIPTYENLVWDTILDASDIGLVDSDFLNYNTTNVNSASIVRDSTGVLLQFRKLLLNEVKGGGGQSWNKVNGDVKTNQILPSGNFLLHNTLQFNYKKSEAGDQPYLYSVFKSKDGQADGSLAFGQSGGNWFMDGKNGVLFIPDYDLVSNVVNTDDPPAISITKYIGKRGLSEFSGGGGGVGGNTLTHLATLGTFQGYMLNTNKVIGIDISTNEFNTTGDRISGTDVTEDTEIDSFDSINSIFSMKKSNTPASPLFIREGYLRDASNVILYDISGVDTSDTQNIKFTQDTTDYNCLIDTRSSYDITFKDLRHNSGIETIVSEIKSTFFGYYNSSYDLVTTAFLTNQFIEEVDTLTRPTQVSDGSNNVYTLQTNSSIQPSETSVMTGFYKGASKFYYDTNSVFDPSAGYYLESLGFTIDKLSNVDTHDSDNGFITINGNNQSQSKFSSRGLILNETTIEMVDLSGINVGMGVYKPNIVVKKPFITSIDSFTKIITLANSDIVKEFHSGFVYQSNSIISGDNVFGVGDVLVGRVETQMPNSTIISALGQQYGIDQSLATSLLGTFKGFAKDNRIYFSTFDLDFIVLPINDQYNTSLSTFNQYVPVNNIDNSIYTQYAEDGFYVFNDTPKIDHPTDNIDYFNGIITCDTSINTLDNTTLIGTKTGYYIKEQNEIIFGSVHNDINIGDGFIDGNENILFNPTVSDISGHIATIPGGENSIEYTKTLGKYIQTGDNTIVVKFDWNYGFEYLDDSESLDWNIINYNDSDYWNTTSFHRPIVNNLLFTPNFLDFSTLTFCNKIQLTHTELFIINEIQIWVKGSNGPVNIVPNSTVTVTCADPNDATTYANNIKNGSYSTPESEIYSATITFDGIYQGEILSIIIYNREKVYTQAQVDSYTGGTFWEQIDPQWKDYYVTTQNGGPVYVKQWGVAIVGSMLNIMYDEEVLHDHEIKYGSPVLMFSTTAINQLTYDDFSNLPYSNDSIVRGYPLIYDICGTNLTTFNKVRVIDARPYPSYIDQMQNPESALNSYINKNRWQLDQIQVWVDGSNIALNASDVSHNSVRGIPTYDEYGNAAYPYIGDAFNASGVIDGDANKFLSEYGYNKFFGLGHTGEYIDITIPETEISKIQSILVFGTQYDAYYTVNSRSLLGKSIQVMKDDVVIFDYMMHEGLRINRIDGEAVFDLNEDAFTQDIYNDDKFWNSLTSPHNYTTNDTQLSKVDTKIHGFKHSNNHNFHLPFFVIQKDEIPSDAIVTTSNYLYDGLFEVTFSSNVTSQTTTIDNSTSIDSVNWNDSTLPTIQSIDPTTFSHYSYKDFELYKKESFAALTQFFDFYTLDTLTVYKSITFTQYPKIDFSVYSTNTYSYRRPIIFTVPDSDVNDQIVGANSTQTLTNKNFGDNVGIGTTNPNCPLEVRKGTHQGQLGSGGTRLNLFNYNSTSFASFQTNVGITDVTVWAHGNMGCLGSIFSHNGGLVASDVRIKTNITDVQDGEALSLLRSLKPKTYSYKDVINRGTNSVYGFIAQEVGETISMSTFTRKETIPNIYQFATVGTDKKTICFYQGFNTNDLDSSSNILQITGVNDEEHFVNIEEIIDASYIRVDTDLSDMMGDVDDSGNIIEGTKVFVYGQQVDDFTFLKKEAIWTVATAALQEVDRQLQAEKTKVVTLESQVAALESQIAALLAKYPVD